MDCGEAAKSNVQLKDDEGRDCIDFMHEPARPTLWTAAARACAVHEAVGAELRRPGSYYRGFFKVLSPVAN